MGQEQRSHKNLNDDKKLFYLNLFYDKYFIKSKSLLEIWAIFIRVYSIILILKYIPFHLLTLSIKKLLQQ